MVKILPIKLKGGRYGHSDYQVTCTPWLVDDLQDITHADCGREYYLKSGLLTDISVGQLLPIKPSGLWTSGFLGNYDFIWLSMKSSTWGPSLWDMQGVMVSLMEIFLYILLGISSTWTSAVTKELRLKVLRPEGSHHLLITLLLKLIKLFGPLGVFPIPFDASTSPPTPIGCQVFLPNSWLGSPVIYDWSPYCTIRLNSGIAKLAFLWCRTILFRLSFQHIGR